MEQINKCIKHNTPTILFASFMFLQYCLLGLANHAGEGYLPADRREMVYYSVQVLVIAGFLCFAAGKRFLRREAARKAAAVILTALLTGASVMLFAGKGSALYLASTFITMPCLGWLGGALFCRLTFIPQYGIIILYDDLRGGNDEDLYNRRQ